MINETRVQGSKPSGLARGTFRYTFEPGDVDQSMPLIYLWEVLGEDGATSFAYVGKALGGAARPLSAYRRNVNNLLAGKPYRRSKPGAFREVHRKLAEATTQGHEIRLTLIENTTVDAILERERHWQQHHKSADPDTPKADSVEQRIAEAVALQLAANDLGVDLAPHQLDGMNFDGFAADPPTLVEVWAHIGPPKPAQKHKVTADGLKLVAADKRHFRGQARKIIVTIDAAAAAPFVDGTWMARAFRDLGIKVLTVKLSADLMDRVRSAQRRQARGNR